MSLSESFQVADAIEKLPPSWKDFKNYLKHKRKEMTMEDLIVRLRIEEDNRHSEKKTTNNMVAKANIVEDANSNKRKRTDEGQHKKKTKKFAGNCNNCGIKGHKAVDCRKPKGFKKKKAQANVAEVEHLSETVSELDLCAVVTECNLISNSNEWFIDTGANRHICANKWMFSTFKATTDEEKIYMGNSSTSKVEGIGKIVLKMTSGKEVTLNNVLYVPEIRKNLVSGSLLSKHGFKMVFVSDKFILSKNEVYLGKGYVSEGLFKMSVMPVVPKVSDINKMSPSVYITESSNIWHARLGHVNFDTVRRLMSLESIPKFRIDTGHKCQVCTEAKMTRSSFPSIVERNTEPLGLKYVKPEEEKGTSLPSLMIVLGTAMCTY